LREYVRRSARHPDEAVEVNPRGQNSALSVTVSFYRTEIEVAPQLPPFAESKPDLASARELVLALNLNLKRRKKWHRTISVGLQS
jgi:hypothetical protein